MATLPLLIQRRGQLKAALTRFKTFFYSNKDSDHVLAIKLRLNKFTPLFDEFQTIQSQIEMLDVETPDLQLEEREAFEDNYFSILTDVETFLNECSFNTAESANSNVSNFHNLTQQIRLPKIELPTFQGSYDTWLSFHDTFHALIHSNASLLNIQKFHYLKSALKGEASQIIQSIELTDSNYELAWELVKGRYENKRLIVQNHINALFNLPVVSKDSATQIRQLIDDVNKHVRALKTLKLPTESWDLLIIHLISLKLDNSTRKEWESSNKTDNLPTLQLMIEFLNLKAQVLSTINNTASHKNQNANQWHQSRNAAHKVQAYSSFTSNVKCPVCSGPHFIYKCDTFLKLPIADRQSEINKHKLCSNCLRSTHTDARHCKSGVCRRCRKRHNTLLHEDAPSEQQEVVSANCFHSGNQMFLSTALVDITNSTNNSVTARTLLDSGSMSHFITRELCRRLELKTYPIQTPIKGINNSSFSATHAAEATIKSKHGSFSTKLTFIVVPEITKSLPITDVDISNLHLPEHINLADPNFNNSSPIDLLLGVGIFYQLLSIGQIKAGPHMPICQNTKLGWIISGNYKCSKQLTNEQQFCHLSLDEQLTKFWEIETPQINKIVLSEQEQFCEDHFTQTTIRDSTGRFVVKFPFLKNPKTLGDSKQNALNLLYSLERRLERDPMLKEQYQEFLDEYIKLGHMSLVNEENSSSSNFYMPHHPVVKPDSLTTKLRVVFNASAKSTSGYSLNDLQAIGPTIQNDLFSILLRFRKQNVALTADITKMYRQVLIAPEERTFQRILWRSSPDEAVKCYELNTVTYGTTAAPFLAIRCLQQIAINNREQYSVASEVIINDFYVDDCITGCNSTDEAVKLRNDIVNILSQGNFHLRKWRSNVPTVLEEFSSTDGNNFIIDKNTTSKTLGLLWNSSLDTLEYTVKQTQPEQHSTKRAILSTIAQLFDPLGILGPIVISAKILLQQIWQLKLQWDEQVPKHIHDLWMKYQEQLPQLKNLRVPRKFSEFATYSQIEIHGFCDSSQQAYGAAVYIRTMDSNSCSVRLLCAKSRVAPLKAVSLPRLELCGAVLLVQLVDKAQTALGIELNSIHYWTDSQIVLCWIHSPSRTWKTFVSNRVSEIHQHSETYQWRHGGTKDNPADLISRGVTPQQLIESEIWFNGPSWLCQSEEYWPNQTKSDETQFSDSVLEARKTSNVFVTITDTSLFSRFSSFNKLRRVIAYILRFYDNCKNPNSRRSGVLSVTELNNAHDIIIKLVQKEAFGSDIEYLKTKACVKPSSNLSSLTPFIDNDGFLRVGGRLRHSTSIDFQQKHPLLLPKSHHITKLILTHYHIINLHSGVQATLTAVRLRYWPLAAKSVLKRIIFECVTCFRVNPKCGQTLMGDLPINRVQPSKPFSYCGIDFCGPFHVSEIRRRGKSHVKTYICIFKCFATKACHLELVLGLTTEAFLGALKRFIARRGKPFEINCDNATTFVGACNELTELSNLFNSTKHKNAVISYTATEGIKWKFIPPRSPHFGGLWESAVKAVKFHLKRIAGNANLTFEEMFTLIAQIESCINSRPLTPMSNDPNDLNPLTPAHFLIGDSLQAVPEPDITNLNVNTLSHWQRVQQCTQHFWKRWSSEYLQQLQQRAKWKDSKPNISINDLVLIRDDNQPPLQWKLGRVIDVTPGSDKVVRVVKLKTSNGIITRVSAKLCPLPVRENPDNMSNVPN